MELLAGDLYGPVNLDDKGENTSQMHAEYL